MELFIFFSILTFMVLSPVRRCFTALRTQSPLYPFNFKELVSPKLFYRWSWYLIKFLRGSFHLFAFVYSNIYSMASTGPGFKVVALWNPFYGAVDSFATNIEAVCNDCLLFFFLASCYACTNSCACCWREGFVSLSVFFFSVPKPYRFWHFKDM